MVTLGIAGCHKFAGKTKPMFKTLLSKIFIPKEDKFFSLFEEMAELSNLAALRLNLLLQQPEPHLQSDAFLDIKAFETKADDIVLRVLAEVDSTFITPFDRQEIQELITKMDDVIDLINAISQQVKLYKPSKPILRAIELADLVVKGTEQIKIAIPEVRNLKKPAKLMQACQNMNLLENQADDIFHDLISELFRVETDPIELVKHKEILETLERITDSVEDVSDVLKTIMIKSA